VRLGLKNYLDVIERAVSMGETVLIENIEESVDPVLDPIIGRNTIKKGRAVKMGDKEVEYNPSFRLILHTKLANPHYKPEMQVGRFLRCIQRRNGRSRQVLRTYKALLFSVVAVVVVLVITHIISAPYNNYRLENYHLGIHNGFHNRKN